MLYRWQVRNILAAARRHARFVIGDVMPTIFLGSCGTDFIHPEAPVRGGWI